MKRVHTLLAAVTLEEKEMRKHKHTIDKAILGFDPKTHVRANARIRPREHLNRTAVSLDLAPPAIGIHRHSQQQKLYEDIHHLLNQWRWIPIAGGEGNEQVSCIT